MQYLFSEKKVRNVYMSNKSLTDKNLWETTWKRRIGKGRLGGFNGVASRLFLTRRMDALFKKLISPKSSFLEIGCGGSNILPRIIRLLSCDGWGLDYSEAGIETCEFNLRQEKVKAKLVLDDLFTTEKLPSSHFDVVFSAGFIEHFTDIPGTINAIQKFVRSDGVLITLVPNLYGLVGTMHRFADKELFDKHIRISPEKMDSYHSTAGMTALMPAFHYGTFCLTVANWNRVRKTMGIFGEFLFLGIKLLQEILTIPFQVIKNPPESKLLSPYIIGVYKRNR